MKFRKRQVIIGALILALGAAVYLNWQMTVPEAKAVSAQKSDDQLGVAELVNNSYVETVNDSDTTAKLDKISAVKAERQSARDEAIDMLKDIIADTEADSNSLTKAAEDAAAIADNMVSEANAEGLIEAKGIDKAVVYISDGNCSVVVSNLDGNELAIMDIINTQTGISSDKIQIIEAK